MLYPDSPPPIIPYDWHWDFATVMSKNPESGRVQTRAGRTIDLLTATLSYPIRPIADYAALRVFARACQGMNQRFTFRDFNGTRASSSAPPLAPWPVDSSFGTAGTGSIITTKSDGTVGIGDGSTLIFDLPFTSTTGAVIYDNGLATTNYSVVAGTGVEGRDRATFTGGHAPAAGHVITAACTLGRLMIYARLATDSFSGKTLVGGGGPIQPVMSLIQDVTF